MDRQGAVEGSELARRGIRAVTLRLRCAFSMACSKTDLAGVTRSPSGAVRYWLTVSAKNRSESFDIATFPLGIRGFGPSESSPVKCAHRARIFV